MKVPTPMSGKLVTVGAISSRFSDVSRRFRRSRMFCSTLVRHEVSERHTHDLLKMEGKPLLCCPFAVA